MQALAMIMVDALRHDYVNPSHMPFLYEQSLKGHRGTLVPPFGFEPDYAIFAGMTPAESYTGTQFIWCPDNSPFWFVRSSFGGLLDSAPKIVSLFARRAIMCIARTLVRESRVRDHPTTARIPLRYLRLFDFSQKFYPFEDEFAGGASIFQIATRLGWKWLFHGFPKHDVRATKVVTAAESELQSDTKLIYIHIGDLDTVGHRYGPGSSELCRALRTVDDAIRSIVAFTEAKVGEAGFLVFGDHGMAGVVDVVDAASVLDTLDEVPGRDYWYFLDSTLMRFWSGSASVLSKIEHRLASLPGVQPLRRQDMKSLGSDFSDRRFGDLMLQLDEGFIVHPSFYSDVVRPEGMHGYGPEARDDHAALLLFPGRAWKPHQDIISLDLAAVPMKTVYELAVGALQDVR